MSCHNQYTSLKYASSMKHSSHNVCKQKCTHVVQCFWRIHMYIYENISSLCAGGLVAQISNLCHPSKSCLPTVRVSLQGTQSSSWLEKLLRNWRGQKQRDFRRVVEPTPFEKHFRLVMSNVNWTIVTRQFWGWKLEKNNFETWNHHFVSNLYVIHPNTYAHWHLFSKWMLHIYIYIWLHMYMLWTYQPSITHSIWLCLKIRDPWKKGGVANKKIPISKGSLKSASKITW